MQTPQRNGNSIHGFRESTTSAITSLSVGVSPSNCRHSFNSPNSVANLSSPSFSSPSMSSDAQKNMEKLGDHDIGKHMHIHACSHMDEVPTVHEIDFEALSKAVLGDSLPSHSMLQDGGLELQDNIENGESSQQFFEEKKSRALKRYSNHYINLQLDCKYRYYFCVVDIGTISATY